MKRSLPKIVIVTRSTRLQGLLETFATKGQARFRMQRAKVAAFAQSGNMDDAMLADEAQEDEDFLELEDEDATYNKAVSDLRRELDFGMPVQAIDRRYVPRLDFSDCAVIVVAGQDGLVANTAKYAAGVPIVGVNPDPRRFDGVLLPFHIEQARDAVSRVLNQRALIRKVTLAEALLHDGQRMLAFNDLFIGARTHTSARYELTVQARSEPQSSSGVLVSTGAGSTGWMSSVYHMACGVAEFLREGASPEPPPPLDGESSELLWAVREPFRSQTSGVELTAGRLEEGQQLRVESRMSGEGVIFSDGMESDFLPFNGGAIVHISAARERAQLVASHLVPPIR